MDDGIELDKVIRETTTPGFDRQPLRHHRNPLLISMSEEGGDVVYVTFLLEVYLRKPRMAGLASEVHQDWRKHFIETRQVSPAQRWCIR